MSAVPKHSAEDRSRRRGVAMHGIIRVASDPIEVEIHDISVSGFKASLDMTLAAGTPVTFATTSLGTHDAQVVWSRGGMHGFSFLRPLSPAAVEQARQVDNVAIGDFGEKRPVSTSQEWEPDVARWPLRQRLLFVAGTSVIAWGLIGYLVFG